MPSLSRKERKRKDANVKKAGQDLSGDAEMQSSDPPSLNVVKPVILDDITEVNDRTDSKDDDGASDVVHLEHQHGGALSEVREKVHLENDDQSAEDMEAEQASLEDIFTSTPPINSEDDALEITPNPPSKKKVKRTKKHTNECPQNPSRKLIFGSSKKKGKKAPKKTSHKMKRKCGREEFQNRDIHQQGVWVQCDNFKCRKWRFLSSVTDPAKVEQHWICTMHPDDTFNSCDKPEEDYTDLEFIHNKFTEGSIVWAKMQGYPWWPAMVESDPDTGCFMEHEGVETEVTHYHCVFLDQTVSRSWVPAIFVKAFAAEGNPPGSFSGKKKNYTKQVMPAKQRALDALNLPLKERIERYGFGKTFKGVWREKKSREKSIHRQDEPHVEEVSEIDDVLGDMLSSEDMEELMNETEGLMAEAEQAVQEMDEQENILGKGTGEETRKIKHSRKRKLSRCDEENRVKRKKHKKKKSKHAKSKKIQGTEKKSRKRPRKEGALKEEVMPGDGDTIHDDKKLPFKSEEKGGMEVSNKERKMGSDNEFEELNHVVQKEEFSDRAEVDQTEMKERKDKESRDKAADDGDMEKNQTKEDEEGDDFMVTVKIEEGDERRPVLSKEKIDVDRSENKLDRESVLGEKELHDADECTEDVKVTGKKHHETTKAEREEKRKEGELKKQCAQEEKERKMKERENKKLKKEKEKQEKEEKKKEREMKKQQALEEKERKKKARLEKAEKKAKKMNKLPESGAGEPHKDDSEKTPVKVPGDAKDGADTKAKKRRFSAPKGKPKAFVPPGGKPKTVTPSNQRVKAHPPQTSLIGDVGKDEKKGEGDGAVALNESSLTKDEENKNVEGNSDKENACLITNEKVKDSRVVPKLKKKKFSVKRKEVLSDSAVKAECRKGSLKTTQDSVPLTTANGPDSQEGKVSGKVGSVKESLMINNKDITESRPNDSPVTTACNVLENNGNNGCGDVGRNARECELDKYCKVQGVDGSWPAKQDHEVNASDNDDVLDLEWSEAPETAGKKSLVTSVNEEDSDPFEAVEE